MICEYFDLLFSVNIFLKICCIFLALFSNIKLNNLTSSACIEKTLSKQLNKRVRRHYVKFQTNSFIHCRVIGFYDKIENKS